MKSKKILSLLLTGAMTAALLAVPAQAAEAPQPEPYTISADHWSREDFCQEANPSVFTGVYSRELYNTIRQTMVDGTSENPAYTMVAKGDDYSAVKNLIGRMEGVLRYEHHVPQNFTDYWRYLDYLSTKDFIAPDSFDFTAARTFRLGQSWGAASYLQIMASELSDKLLLELLELDAEMTVTLHVQTVDQLKAIKMTKGKISDIDKMKVEEQKKAVRAGYDMLRPDRVK